MALHTNETKDSPTDLDQLSNILAKDNLEELQRLIVSNDPVISQRDQDGNNLLMQAAACNIVGDLKCLKYLLQIEKFPLENRNNAGHTAYHLSHSCLQREELERARADIYAEDNEGLTKFEFRLLGKRHDPSIETRRGNEPYKDEVVFMLENYDINHKNDNGDTALIKAVRSNHVAAVKLLLNKGNVLKDAIEEAMDTDRVFDTPYSKC